MTFKKQRWQTGRINGKAESSRIPQGCLWLCLLRFLPFPKYHWSEHQAVTTWIWQSFYTQTMIYDNARQWTWEYTHEHIVPIQIQHYSKCTQTQIFVAPENEIKSRKDLRCTCVEGVAVYISVCTLRLFSIAGFFLFVIYLHACNDIFFSVLDMS